MGGSGREAKRVIQQQSPAELEMQRRAGVGGSPGVAQALQQYGQGGMSLQEAMQAARGQSAQQLQGKQAELSKLQGQYDNAVKEIARSPFINEDQARQMLAQQQPQLQAQMDALGGEIQQLQQAPGIEEAQLRQELLTDPIAGRRAASEQVLADPVLSQLFGQGDDTLMSRLQADEQRLGAEDVETAERLKNLRETGFGMQQQDHEAFGQAAGDITRRAGQQQQQLAQSLAARGFGGAGSGMAGAGFSGIAGNKFERLAKAQTDIADRRYQRNMQRIQQNMQQQAATRGAQQAGRGMQMGLGQQYGQELGSQFGRAMAGREMGARERGQAAGQAFGQRGAEQQQANMAFMQREMTRPKNFGEVMGEGLGTIFGGFTGGLGKKAGGMF